LVVAVGFEPTLEGF